MEWPISQVAYGYQFTGENVPPIGCLNIVNIPAALDLKFGLFSLSYTLVLTLPKA